MPEMIDVTENKKCRILSILLKEKGFVSGQRLCDLFGITRTAVWKILSQLTEEGYEIESVPRKGYRLLACPEVITPELTGARLLLRCDAADLSCGEQPQAVAAGRTMVYYDVTGSSNNDAKRLAEEGAPDGTLVIADCQVAGKGRRGRSWSNPAGKTIAMSLLLRPEIQPSHASMLTLVMGMAAARACAEILEDERICIKWPNDIVYEGKKLSGILTEMSSEIDYVNYVVIGIGINTNLEEFPPEISDVATSLQLIAGKPQCRSAVIASTMFWFDRYLDRFLQTQDMSLLKEEYNRLLAGIGGPVRVLDPAGEYTGISRGINDRGELLVELPDGTVSQVYAGEVSVRGIYGYSA